MKKKENSTKNWWKIIGFILLLLLVLNNINNQAEEIQQLKLDVSELKWKVEINDNVASYAHDKILRYHPGT